MNEVSEIETLSRFQWCRQEKLYSMAKGSECPLLVGLRPDAGGSTVL